ncbi:MAG: hypothetical protein U0797_00350 [Gemmataceae bacterium]
MSSRNRVLLLIVALAGLALSNLPKGGGATPGQIPGKTNKVRAGQLLAGVARVEITSKKALPVNDPLYVKALVVKNDSATAAVVTLDAVAVGEIGHIGNDYLGKVRARLQKELSIAPECVMVNASHCHGVVCPDVDDRTVEAVRQAARNMVPVRVGVGVGHEDRVSENRRLKLKSGKEVDVRHAYSMPADEEVAEVGPIDPEVGVLRLDREDGRTLAVVYNFACHPIMGVPNGGNTADMTGFASRVIENNLGEGTIALFVQGCGGDINPVGYKDIHRPRDAEPLGNLLGLSVLRAVRKVRCVDGGTLRVLNESLELPRADLTGRIDSLLKEQGRLLQSLQGTTLNLRSFLELAGKNAASAEFPSYYSHRYLHEKKAGRADLSRLDRENRDNVKAYVQNIRTMEELTRLQTNLALLRKHQERNRLAGMKPLKVEMVGLRIGDFVLITFPGELTVEIGLNIKKSAPGKHTFVAGYTNGYIYYTPTARQLQNVGGAQEDSDCLLAPEWEKLFLGRVSQMLKKLQ